MKEVLGTPDAEAGMYRSGVAARLAGVPVGTLRIWERRYAVVGPRMSDGGQRLYSSADIQRLSLIKQLVDMGNPIGTIASLSADALARLQVASLALRSGAVDRPAVDGAAGIRVALVGRLLCAEQFGAALAARSLQVVGRCADAAQAATSLAEVTAEIVIIELPSLPDECLDLIAGIKAACKAADVLVLYRFAPGAVVRRMRMAGHVVMRATADAAEIAELCRGVAGRAGARAGDVAPHLQIVEPRPPRFDQPTLAALAMASRTVECECPTHLVELVLNLGSFERYSAQCASRSPADALLHLDLQRAAGFARAIIERALERVALAEGFALPAANEGD